MVQEPPAEDGDGQVYRVMGADGIPTHDFDRSFYRDETMTVKLWLALFKLILQVIITLPLLDWLKPPIFAGLAICVLVAVIVDSSFIVYQIKLKLLQG